MFGEVAMKEIAKPIESTLLKEAKDMVGAEGLNLSDLDKSVVKDIETNLDINENKNVSGGSYRDVKKFVDENGFEDIEVHHMPANSITELSLGDGPAIAMEKNDHRETASCGNSREAQEYRAMQKELVDKGEFRKALQMDIEDIQEKFGDKYDSQIKQMLEYVDTLGQEGKI